MANFGPYYQRAITGGQNLETGDINSRYFEDQSSLTGGMPALRGYSPAITNTELAQTATDTGTNVTSATTGATARPTSTLPFGNFIGGFLGPTVTSMASGTPNLMAGVRGVGTAALGYGLAQIPGSTPQWTSTMLATGLPQTAVNALTGVAGLPSLTTKTNLPQAITGGLSKLGLSSAPALTPYLYPATMLAGMGWSAYDWQRQGKKQEKAEKHLQEAITDRYSQYKSQFDELFNRYVGAYVEPEKYFVSYPKQGEYGLDPAINRMVRANPEYFPYAPEALNRQEWPGLGFSTSLALNAFDNPEPILQGIQRVLSGETNRDEIMKIWDSYKLDEKKKQELINKTAWAGRADRSGKSRPVINTSELEGIDPFVLAYVASDYTAREEKQLNEQQQKEWEDMQREWVAGGAGQF